MRVDTTKENSLASKPESLVKAMIITGQTTNLCERLHFSTSNPDTKVVCDTALQWSLQTPHYDIISLCYESTLHVGKQLMRPAKRWYLWIPPMYYSVNLLLFPFSNTTVTGNIGFSAYFCRQWNDNSHFCYQYELPFWFLDAINVNLKELPYKLYLYVLLYALSTLQIGKSQRLLL